MIKQKTSVLELCVIGIFAAVIAVCSLIAIPTPSGVPFTLQTFAVALAGVVLGAGKGAVAATVYLMLGAIGAPVFHNFTGGLGVLVGPTGGFLLSFPLLSFIAGYGARSGKVLNLSFALAAAVVANYTCGLLYFMLVMSSSLITAITYCALPFIIPDIVKMALVAVVGRAIRAALVRNRLT